MTSAFGRWRVKLSRIRRALVGRACRYRIGRRLWGAPPGEEPLVDMLGPDSLAPWEDYLRAPRGTLRLPGGGTYCAVALWRGAVVGHVSVFKQWERPDVMVPGWWLTGLEVSPRWRGRSVGGRLVRRVIDAWQAGEPGQDLYLVVHRRNGPAIALFEGYGFRVFHDDEWQRRLQGAYPWRRRGGWAYLIMKRGSGAP